MAEISPKAEKDILEATWELHNMCLEAVDLVINDPSLLRLFNINENLWRPIKKHWVNNQ